MHIIFLVKIINITDEKKKNKKTTLQLQISHAYYAANQPNCQAAIGPIGKANYGQDYYLSLLLLAINKLIIE
jgi:hypothetical protein